LTCEYDVMDDHAPVQALIIVDAQRGFLLGEEAVPNAARLIDRISDLLARARKARALVVHLQNDGSTGAVNAPGQSGWALHLPVVASADEVVIRSSGPEDTGLAGHLADRGVRRLVIGGLLSETRVSATARAALARGLEVVLPHDAHATYDLDDIPAIIVARVAEHAIGGQLELVRWSADVPFTHPPT
jgi:nicotinamidase-related amidase